MQRFYKTPNMPYIDFRLHTLCRRSQRALTVPLITVNECDQLFEYYNTHVKRESLHSRNIACSIRSTDGALAILYIQHHKL